jgi:hypothetical protein
MTQVCAKRRERGGRVRQTGAMRYDLGVWASPRPRDDVEAAELFARLSEEMDREEAEVPTVLLAAFARDLLHRWPDLQVWATAEGVRVGVGTEPAGVDRVVTDVAGLARAHGMICYDPQRRSRIA